MGLAQSRGLPRRRDGVYQAAQLVVRRRGESSNTDRQQEEHRAAIRRMSTYTGDKIIERAKEINCREPHPKQAEQARTK